MKRDELIEAMARALCNTNGDDPDAKAWSVLDKEAYTGRERAFSPAWRDYVDDATAALAAIEAAGAVVVPREASSAMIRDGVSYRLSTSLGGKNRWPEDTVALYTAMIAASPYGGR